MRLSNDWLSTAFVVTWIVVAIASVVASRKMNAVSKRRWMPWGMFLVGVLFLVFTSALTVRGAKDWSSLWNLVWLIPAVALIGYIIIRFTKICDHCGTTSYNHNWFTPMIYCSKCGEKYDPREDGSRE